MDNEHDEQPQNPPLPDWGPQDGEHVESERAFDQGNPDALVEGNRVSDGHELDQTDEEATS